MEFMDLIEIPRVDNVRYGQYFPDVNKQSIYNKLCDGSICLTSHHLIFSPKDKSETNYYNKEILVQHCLIDTIESKIRDNQTKSVFQIILKCKNFQMFLVDFPNLYACNSIVRSLEALSNITSENMKFPFFYQLTFEPTEDETQIYSVESEFKKFFKNQANCEWRISQVNADYALCHTYPQKLIVPASIDDSMLVKSSQFRSSGRFPVLSYYHRPTKAFLMRCGQPLLGPSKKRCKEDEMLLKANLQMGKKGFIFDLRDGNSLKSITSKGGGYETEANYPLWTRINRHCDGHEALHQSLSKLLEACFCSDMDKWLNKLETSSWIGSIRQLLHVAVCVADEMHNKNGCVVVHGSDGIDNTLIITSLVHLILNPATRTVKGFQSLIEKEWLHAGHPFSKRCFKSAFGSTTQKNEGPVFLMFLECTRQLMEQFCLSFEFNEDFLILLFDNVYASEFGTFLGTCQMDREILFVSTRTASIWSYVNYPKNLKKFINPLYQKNMAVIWPSLYPQSMSLWTGLFLRHQRNEEPFIEAKTELIKMCDEHEQARLRIENLKKEALELENEAQSKGII